jgi:hypothetical protein
MTIPIILKVFYGIYFPKTKLTTYDQDIFEHILMQEMLDIQLLQLILMIEHYQKTLQVVPKDQQQNFHHDQNIDQLLTKHMYQID